jgi:beta-galactosidase/beta-glucuronidase
MKVFTLLIPLFLLEIATFSQEVVRNTFLLNGTWQFEQTLTAFPPSNFSRTIPVPGLIHLADPRIEEYDVFFKKPDQVEKKQQHNLQDIDYTPRYSWYRKKVFIPKDLKGKEAVLTIKKSQYVTQVYINGWDAGGSMACYTPIDLNITSALKYGKENEILIRIGDRIWLPSEAAGSTDKEKEHYLPGIWDDVLLSFTGKIRLHRVLVLPSLKNENVNIKVQIRNYYPAQLFYGDPMHDNVEIGVVIKEKKTGKAITSTSEKFEVKRDNLTKISIQIPVEDIHPWSVEDPFLYAAEVLIKSKNENNDKVLQSFGIRDFERRGRYFYLNDKRIILRGTNITLQRFFEDPECGNLAWDREWVKSLLIDASKELNWNMMRICVGIVPDFWYDIADENGLMFQNEWFYWQNHGWDAQVRKEYQDWIWSDGNHPSIVIWDAINENWDSYIGNTLIPDLMKLDPTRIWDAGYMTGSEMNIDEMDEPHPYDGVFPRTNIEAYEKKPYPLGDLNYMNKTLKASIESGAAQLVNEYGWIWLWRDGRPSKLTVIIYYMKIQVLRKTGIYKLIGFSSRQSGCEVIDH